MTSPAVAAAALASLYQQDPKGIEQCFGHLTAPNLESLDAKLQNCCWNNQDDNHDPKVLQGVIATAMIRRIVHRCLDKHASQTNISAEEVQQALKHYSLPEPLQSELHQRYPTNDAPPETWWDSLTQLRQQTETNSKTELWTLLLDHPMTAYVPFQCQSCGHVVPDDGNWHFCGYVCEGIASTSIQFHGQGQAYAEGEAFKVDDARICYN